MSGKIIFRIYYSRTSEGQAVILPEMEKITNPELDTPISMAEMKSALQRIILGKASGADGIPGECFKAAG